MDQKREHESSMYSTTTCRRYRILLRFRCEVQSSEANNGAISPHRHYRKHAKAKKNGTEHAGHTASMCRALVVVKHTAMGRPTWQEFLAKRVVLYRDCGPALSGLRRWPEEVLDTNSDND